MAGLDRPLPERSALRAAFAATRVRIRAGDGWLEVHPGGTEPSDGALAGPVQVLTAWNPQGRHRPLAANQADQHRLEDQLADLGLAFQPAAGIGEAGDWAEASVGVTGLDRATAGQVARRWDQAAHFEWRPGEGQLAVVWADGALDQWPVGVDRLDRRPCPLAPPGDRAGQPCLAPTDPADRRSWAHRREILLAAAGCDVCHGEPAAPVGHRGQTTRGGVGAGQEEG